VHRQTQVGSWCLSGGSAGKRFRQYEKDGDSCCEPDSPAGALTFVRSYSIQFRLPESVAGTSGQYVIAPAWEDNLSSGFKLKTTAVTIYGEFVGPNFVNGLARQNGSYDVLSDTLATLTFAGGLDSDVTYVQLVVGTGIGIDWRSGRYSGRVAYYYACEEQDPENSWSFTGLSVALDTLNTNASNTNVTFGDLLVVPLQYNFIGGDFDDIYITGSFDDIAKGNKGDDYFIGLSGNDTLMGNSGDDRLAGGQGDDLLQGGNGNDVLNGGADDDRLEGGSGRDALNGGRGRDVVIGGNGNDVARGGGGSDLVLGDDGDDKVIGSGGKDRLRGGDGDDQIHGGSGADTIKGNRGDDEIFGGAGSDTIAGGRGADIVKGGKGTNILYGNRGSDELHGNNGTDEYPS
jgi:Ca2+-binding RTX toxin-like protein